MAIKETAGRTSLDVERERVLGRGFGGKYAVKERRPEGEMKSTSGKSKSDKIRVWRKNGVGQAYSVFPKTCFWGPKTLFFGLFFGK